MGRGPKSTKGKAKPGVSRKTQKKEDSKVRDLEKRLAEAREQLTAARAQVTESHDQQTATNEILKVISSSPTDVQPVFDTIAENTLRLCEATFSAVFRYDSELIHLAALRDVTPEGAAAIRGMYPMPPGRGGSAARSILSRDIAHIPDVIQDPEYAHRGVAETAEFRSILSVPMLRDGQPIGALTVARPAARPFPDKQVELLRVFAAQAVIAIENVRLFNETKEALERQTATSEILSVISSSPTDIQPVFDAIARNAVQLCGGVLGTVFRVDGELMHVAALHGYSAEGEAAVRRTFPRRPDRGVVAARAVLTRSIVHVPDVADDPEFEHQTVATTAGWRSLLVVPMLRGGDVIGTVSVHRALPGLFRDQEIGLLQTFADQAVIAIENVRLFTELQEKNQALTQAHARVSEALAWTIRERTRQRPRGLQRVHGRTFMGRNDGARRRDGDRNPGDRSGELSA